MSLPSNFQFSQSSLQDFVDCQRRFQLKYIEQLAWPALEAEPALENENYLRKGATFHHLIQQFFHGVSVENLTTLAKQNPNLEHWWKNFTQVIGNLVNLKANNHPEFSLSAPIRDYRLVAKYDLLSFDEEKITIYDWKTSRSHQQQKREWVATKLQTRVYPFLLVKVGAHINSGKYIEPSQVEMLYWYANIPASPLKFRYSDQKFNEDQVYIDSLIEEIKTLDESKAAMTDNQKRCCFCIYRSLCDRGDKAGPLGELIGDNEQSPFGFDFNFEQIAEIEF